MVKDFSKQKALVVGDLILDQYIRGAVRRISPEAPVQIVEVDYEEYVPGGAANVAHNLRTLGAQVDTVGLVGDDLSGKKLIQNLNTLGIETNGVLVDHSRKTTVKVRVLGGRQQIVRFDYESTHEPPDQEFRDVLKKIISKLENYDVVVVSDYAKGLVTGPLISELVSRCKEKQIPFIVDPKPSNTKLYHDIDVITPNFAEACTMVGLSNVAHNDQSVEQIGLQLASNLNTNALITRSEQGMSLIERGGQVTHIPTHTGEVVDIVGAGDTVVAAMALGLGSGAGLIESAKLANKAASIVVTKVGTATVSGEELFRHD